MTAPHVHARDPAILSAAHWLADQRVMPAAAALTVVDRFGLSIADAVDAVLLAGKFSICRKAFG